MDRGTLTNAMIWSEFGLALGVASARLHANIFLMQVITLDTWEILFAVANLLL